MSEENTKIGTVVKCDDHQAIVRVQHALTCTGADPGCPYNAMYFGVTTPETLEITAENHVNANVGDLVAIALSSHKLVQAVFYTFGIPLLFFFGGIAIGSKLNRWYSNAEELGTIIGGILALILSLIVVKTLGKHFKPDYRIIKILKLNDIQLRGIQENTNLSACCSIHRGIF